MSKSKIYLVLQAVVCVALAVLLSASAIGIWQEGSARKTEHPMESVYTPENVAGKFAPIAPLFFVGVGLLIAGLVMGAKDENAEKPGKDAELSRDLIVSRVAQPSAEMTSEQKKQRKLKWIGWGLFALCMVPILVFLLNPANFPEDDPESMFHGLLRVFLPWTAVGLGALAVTSVLQEKSVLRETKAAQERMKAEKAGKTEEPAANVPSSGSPSKARVAQVILLIVAAGCILAGIFNGSALDVLYKAITICTECVGLG